MSKTLWVLCLAFGTVVTYAAPGGGHGGGGGGSNGPNATFTLTCSRGVTATLDQLTVYNDAPAVATMLGLCGGQPSITCSGNSVSLVCAGVNAGDGASFTVKGYTTPNTTGPPPWGLNVTDSKGNTNTCIASGVVPSSFSCATSASKGATLKVVNSN